MKILTIGHSNHAIETFIALLRQHEITAIADVRSSPFSRRFPQFNQTPLKNSLSSAGISYVFLGEELGARPKDIRCYVDSKARYELIAATDAFAKGLERIVTGAKHYQIALMCAEQDPITCHRAILVCRYLQNKGLEINHILKNGDLESHQHLETRLLELHNLSKISSANTFQLGIQLQLFETDIFDVNYLDKQAIKNMSFEELIEQAYQLQGDKIAYTEKSNQVDE